MEVWTELRGLGLDVTFVLESLIGKVSSISPEPAFSSDAASLLEGVKG
jgi:hypothetical protein